MQSTLCICVLLLIACTFPTEAGRLQSRSLREKLREKSSTFCDACPSDLAAEAYVSMDCCSCVDGWEVVTMDQGLLFCVQSAVLLDEASLRLLTTFTGKLLDAYMDDNTRDDEAGEAAAKKDGGMYVSQGTAENLIALRQSDALSIIARVNSRDYTSGASARYNRLTGDFTVGAAQGANFLMIRLLFPFENRFQSVNDKRITMRVEDRPGRHPGFKKITTNINQNSAIEIAAVVFVPTFPVI